jgi:hypothetical protein
MFPGIGERCTKPKMARIIIRDDVGGTIVGKTRLPSLGRQACPPLADLRITRNLCTILASATPLIYRRTEGFYCQSQHNQATARLPGARNEWRAIMKWKWSILVLAFSVISCSNSGTSPEPRNFNLKFSYGVGAKNVLNTYSGTYTKDLIVDGTTTVPFILSDRDIERIKEKMLEIGFYSYPDTFSVPQGDTVVTVTPHSTYIFDVTNNSLVKHLYWSDHIVNQDSAAVKLRELITFIEGIIESNPGYLQLPPARGGYL